VDSLSSLTASQFKPRYVFVFNDMVLLTKRVESLLGKLRGKTSEESLTLEELQTDNDIKFKYVHSYVYFF